ncbi:DUF3618 domain-containing protein [Streptomyces sp. NPDC002402]
MTDKSRNNDSVPTADELREQVEGTRLELGQTVDALSAKADIKAQAQQKATKVKTQVQDKAAHALHVAHDKTPEPVREKAAHAKQQLTEKAQVLGAKIQDTTPEPVHDRAGQMAQVARGNRKLLIAGATVLTVILLARSRRKSA